MYSQKIYNSIIGILDEANFRYDVNEETGGIWIPRNTVDSMGRTITIAVEVRETDYIVRGWIDGFSFSEQNHSKLVELAMRINGRYIFPFLVVDYSNSPDIICQHFCDVGDRCISKNDFLGSIYTIFNHFIKYGKAIIAVSMGFQNPEDALNDAE